MAATRRSPSKLICWGRAEVIPFAPSLQRPHFICCVVCLSPQTVPEPPQPHLSPPGATARTHQHGHKVKNRAKSPGSAAEKKN